MAAAKDLSRDGTGAGLVKFFDYLAEKGLMNKSTAGARKTASVKVLSIDENWETVDLRQLDVDEQADRFERLEKQNYQPNSLSVYRSRFRSAVKEYLDYLDNPSSFKAPGQGPSNSSNGGLSKKGATRGTGRDETQTDESSSRGAPARDNQPHAGTTLQQKLITYPFPLRGAGTMAYLQLPPDLRPDEAGRLARFLESLALPRDEQAERDE